MSAVISACGTYRYLLTRELEAPGAAPVTFIMLNPSTANATEDDPTVSRCKAYALGWGFSQLRIVNMFAFRATQPRDLRAAYLRNEDVVGPHNDDYIRYEARTSGMLICAWGANAERYETRLAHVLRILRQYKPLYLLGRTNAGGPKHPLYLNSRLRPRLYMEQFR